ncbi:regulatory signaling modulator protein AmpE [endosymbiont of Ridgeia piscesae]|jgi:membrane protein required for beta-lactamase induction|uniref:AmpE protein n=1 Tax=endosymbiont of Ridgeia piscesae TaxID=54398 RepID=A0A0T5Z3I3_9GAMM|nr:regulatory signaling modulator protein AmpE [endosymbiont of Ridgeia piscesae]KRT55198.1 Membrane protein required for beta-lactamase induction [endosymbiont of Ridgeia piscesae]KRT57463.1 AmpE protein [endosymbiont of Ridgeia piscesae]
MSLLIIISCLIAERFLLQQQELRDPHWFARYSSWYQEQELSSKLTQGFGGVIGLLLPPLLLVALLQALLDGMLFDLPSLLFAGALLLFCFGPQDLDQQASRFVEARERGNEDQARVIARQLIGDEPPTQEPAYSQAVTEGILSQANSRLFAVIFWFLLLGPLGAILYRVASLLPSSHLADESLDFYHASRDLLGLLDWLPVRITAFSYAIAGSFEDALFAWRNYSENSSGGLLVATGSGALRMSNVLEQAEVSSNDGLYLIEAAMSLVWRALISWILLLALLTLAGWI